MKKRTVIMMLITAGTVLLAACGSSSKSYSLSYKDDGAMMMEATADYANYDMVESRSSINASPSYQKSSGGATASAENVDVVTRKVIKTASLEVQTRTFDDFIDALNQKIAEFGGYLQNANISGNNIYSSSTRTAYYTIRVPENKIQPMIDSIGELGTVTTSSYNEEDITLAYVDVESRIKTLTTEQETLLGLLEKAAYLEDIIRLEERLSEVNYQLESYKSRQRTYDDKISYSTLNVSIKEVMRIATVVEPEPQTLGQRIANGFKDNMMNIKDNLENFIVWFVSYIINIILFCGITTLVVILCVRFAKKKTGVHAKTETRDSENDETKMGNNK